MGWSFLFFFSARVAGPRCASWTGAGWGGVGWGGVGWGGWGGVGWGGVGWGGVGPDVMYLDEDMLIIQQNTAGPGVEGAALCSPRMTRI